MEIFCSIKILKYDVCVTDGKNFHVIFFREIISIAFDITLLVHG